MKIGQHSARTTSVSSRAADPGQFQKGAARKNLGVWPASWRATDQAGLMPAFSSSRRGGLTCSLEAIQPQLRD
jgi:hypothetical protein